MSKIFKIGAVVVALVVIVALLKFNSYVKTGARMAKESVSDMVPVDYQIETAKELIDNLDDTIQKCKKQEILQRQEIKEIEEKLEDMTDDLADQEFVIVEIRKQICDDQDEYVFNNRTYTRKQVELDLERKFARYNRTEATIGHLVNLLDAKRQAADAMLSKINTIMDEQNNLRIDVENLIARQELLDVMRISGGYDVDETELAKIDDVIKNLNSRIEVAEQMATMQFNEIKIDEPDTNLLAEIDMKFGE